MTLETQNTCINVVWKYYLEIFNATLVSIVPLWMPVRVIKCSEACFTKVRWDPVIFMYLGFPHTKPYNDTENALNTWPSKIQQVHKAESYVVNDLISWKYCPKKLTYCERCRSLHLSYCIKESSVSFLFVYLFFPLSEE